MLSPDSHEAILLQQVLRLLYSEIGVYEYGLVRAPFLIRIVLCEHKKKF